MQVKIGRNFFYKENDITFEKGKVYTVKNELAWWIVRKRLGEIIPNVNIEIPKEKEITKAPKDKMMRTVKTKKLIRRKS